MSERLRLLFKGLIALLPVLFLLQTNGTIVSFAIPEPRILNHTSVQTPEQRAKALQKLEAARARLIPFQNDLLRIMDVRSGQTIADVGAGGGAFAVRLAQAVGTEGRVFANEIAKDLVDKLEAMKIRENLPQLTVVLGREDDPLLPDRVDRLSMIEVYHHLTRPEEFMASCLKSVKPGGLLAVAAVDVNRWTGNRDPKTREVCISDPDETRAAIEKTGWVFMKMEHPQSYEEMYVLVFVAPH